MDQQAPPGWYQQGVHTRWWTGSEWGPVAAAPPMTPQSVEEAGKLMAVISHLGPFLGVGFLAPLIVFMMDKDRNQFSRHHSVEALNFQLSVMAVTFGAIFLAAMMMFLVAVSEAFIVLAVVLFIVSFIAMFANIGFGIFGAIKASQLEYWRYPINIRFVK